ncbi:uncharacterized protein LOC119371002 [Jatropha curcas]|uniref:uncharacterized protein LOC119371002 n=1 Tax=Jatropha curcas TaxID=180498 RepID=UPI001894C5E0|nr:uncharacterized protein LOC119371002 [Jatropha curcas]
MHPGSTISRFEERLLVARHEERHRRCCNKMFNMSTKQVKAEHQLPSGLLHPITVPTWKWDQITMDVVTGLPQTQRKHDAVWVIVDRLTKSAHFLPVKMDYSLDKLATILWTKLSEKKILGPDLVRDTEEKAEIIRRRLKEASDRQKSYADLKRKDIEYSVGDKVFLKASPWKKILRFGQKGKLSPRFIGPYEIVERVGPLAYRLALPPTLDRFIMSFMYQC